MIARLCGLLFLLRLLPRGSYTVKAAFRARDAGYCFEDAIGVLRRHLEELLRPLLAIERLHRAEVRVKTVYELVKRLVRQPMVGIVGRVRPKRIWQGLGAV